MKEKLLMHTNYGLVVPAHRYIVVLIGLICFAGCQFIFAHSDNQSSPLSSESVLKQMVEKYWRAEHLRVNVHETVCQDNNESPIEQSEFEVVLARPDAIYVCWNIDSTSDKPNIGYLVYPSDRGGMRTSSVEKLLRIPNSDMVEGEIYAVGTGARVVSSLFFENWTNSIVSVLQSIDPVETGFSRSGVSSFIIHGTSVSGVSSTFYVSQTDWLLLQYDAVIKREDGSTLRYTQEYTYHEVD